MNKTLGFSLVVMVMANIVLTITVVNLTYQAEEMIIEIKADAVQLDGIDDAMNLMMKEDKS